VSRTSAYRLRVKTDSADSNGILLFDDGELIAILLELADESHGEDRGKWVIETVFSVELNPPRSSFASAEEASIWVMRHFSGRPFMLGPQLVQLS
jgi:hypothetical protein